MATLLSASPAVFAGSYSAPVYSGGQTTTTSSNVTGPPVPHLYSQQGSTDSVTNTLTYGGGNLTTWQANAQGQPVTFSLVTADAVNPITQADIPVTAKFTWQPAYADEPAPKSVIVTQHCTAGWIGSTNGNGTFQGFCDSGLGKSSGLGSMTATCNATKYTIQTPAADGSVTVTCSPGATVSGASGTSGSVLASVSVTYSAGVSPVTTTPTGVTPVGTTLKALTGQQLGGRLNGIPFTPAAGSTYQWSVSTTATPPVAADVFKDYDPTLSSNQLVLLSGTDLTGSSFKFYDKSGEIITINCVANVVAPDGTHLSLTAKSPPIAVVKPSANWPAMQVGVKDDPINKNFAAGELWSPIDITVPSPFSGGYGCIAQLGTFNRQIKRHALNGKPATYYYTFMVE